MIRIAIATATASVFLVLGSAHAQVQAPQASPFYGELGYTLQEIENGGLGFKANPQALRGIVGYDFHPNLAAEGMLAFGTTDDSDRGVSVKLRNQIGVFAKPKYSFDNFEVFGRLGWVRTKLRASAPGIAASGSDDDFAWGAGVNYHLSPRTYVGLDYLRSLDKGGTRINGWTLGVGYRF
jgi:outer membrane autotransporter protein